MLSRVQVRFAVAPTDLATPADQDDAIIEQAGSKAITLHQASDDRYIQPRGQLAQAGHRRAGRLL